MLVPRFTIRALLVMLTVCAFVFVIAGMAVRGQHWAWGITIGILSLAFTMLVHAAWFTVVRMLEQMQSRQKEEPAVRSD
jgi:Na+/melibiose symporter-like transporter